jgi:hypothetical protein
VSISLTDSKNWSAQLNGAGSIFDGKSLKLPSSDLFGIWNKPLSAASFKTAGIGPGTVKFSGNTPLPFAGTTLTVGATQGAAIGGQVGGDLGCICSEFDEAISLKQNACLWLKLAGTVDVGVSGSFSGFGIGLKAKSFSEYRFTQVVMPDASGTFCTLADGFELLFAHAVAPRDMDALLQAPAGAIYEFDSGGSITFTGSYSLPSSTLPLATASIPVLKDKLSLQSNASLGVTGSFEVSGALVFRVYKVSDKLARFQIFKKRGASLSVSFDASAGITGGVGGKDLIDSVFKLIKPDISSLNAVASDPGLNDQIKDVVQEAIAAHLAASLSIDANPSSSLSHLFLVDIDLQTAKSSQQMQDRVNALFHGDWSLAAQHNLPCVTDWSDEVEQVTKLGTGFRLHLLNIFGAVSVADFLTSAKILRAPDGVVFTDHNTASQVEAVGNIAEPKSLSKVLARALESTLVFKSTKVSPVLAELSISGHCFQFEQNGSRDDLVEIACLSDALDCPLKLPLPTTSRVGVLKFDGSTNFDSSGSDACFVGPAPDFTPKLQEEYVRHALDAITELYPSGDPFHAAATDNQLWPHLSDKGNPSAMIQDAYVQNFLRQHGGYDNNPGNLFQVQWLYSIWYTVTFWSDAMAKYAALLQKAKKLTGQISPGDTQNIPEVQELMNQLASAMRDAQKLETNFIDARAQFGMAALYLSSGKRSANEVSLSWNANTLSAKNTAALAARVR